MALVDARVYQGHLFLPKPNLDVQPRSGKWPITMVRGPTPLVVTTGCRFSISVYLLAGSQSQGGDDPHNCYLSSEILTFHGAKKIPTWLHRQTMVAHGFIYVHPILPVSQSDDLLHFTQAPPCFGELVG